MIPLWLISVIVVWIISVILSLAIGAGKIKIVFNERPAENLEALKERAFQVYAGIWWKKKHQSAVSYLPQIVQDHIYLLLTGYAEETTAEVREAVYADALQKLQILKKLIEEDRAKEFTKNYNSMVKEINNVP